MFKITFLHSLCKECVTKSYPRSMWNIHGNKNSTHVMILNIDQLGDFNVFIAFHLIMTFPPVA